MCQTIVEATTDGHREVRLAASEKQVWSGVADAQKYLLERCEAAQVAVGKAWPG